MSSGLDADEIDRVYGEAVLGREPTNKSPEALALRKSIDKEIAEARARGDKGQWMPLTIEQ